jgi:flagellar motility protein MotE (MotC chaperone)
MALLAQAALCLAQEPPLQAAGGDFCVNIADRARDARYVLQKEALDKARQDLAEQKADLAARESAFAALQKARESEIKAAQKGLVDIYAKMKPDAAASQLALMGVGMASAILHELNVRAASAILNQMEPEIAARISARLASAADLPTDAGGP